jgi:hypothetical protein
VKASFHMSPLRVPSRNVHRVVFQSVLYWCPIVDSSSGTSPRGVLHYVLRGVLQGILQGVSSRDVLQGVLQGFPSGVYFRMSSRRVLLQ